MKTVNSRIPYHAVPLPCHDHAALKSDFPRRRHSTAEERHGHGLACENLQRPSRDGMWATRPGSASSGYYADIHEGCLTSTLLPCGFYLIVLMTIDTIDYTEYEVTLKL